MFNLRVYGILINEKNQVLVADLYIRGKYYTKFPGGGMEYGEGTRECLVREFREELDLEIETGGHIYTTDFYQPSAFHEKQQIISMYYRVNPKSPIKAPLREKPFDFNEKDMAIYEETGETEVYRFVDLAEFDENTVSLPIDKIVAGIIKEG